MIYTKPENIRIDLQFVPLPEWVPCPFCVVGGMPYRNETGDACVRSHILELHPLDPPKK